MLRPSTHTGSRPLSNPDHIQSTGVVRYIYRNEFVDVLSIYLSLPKRAAPVENATSGPNPANTPHKIFGSNFNPSTENSSD